MLQYPQKIPIDFTMRYRAWGNIKNLNQILHFWNLYVKGFQTVYRLSKSNRYLGGSLIQYNLWSCHHIIWNETTTGVNRRESLPNIIGHLHIGAGCQQVRIKLYIHRCRLAVINSCRFSWKKLSILCEITLSRLWIRQGADPTYMWCLSGLDRF